MIAGAWDALGLVEVVTGRRPDEGNAIQPAVLAHDHVPGFVALFQDLVMDYGDGFFPLPDVPAKVERLLQSDSELGLVIRRAEEERVDSAVGSRETMF